MSESVLEIIGVECDDGRVFISLVRREYHFSAGRLEGLLFDGVKPDLAFLRDWVVIPKKPESVQKLVPQPSINYRYELIDPELESDKFPAVFRREDVAEVDPGETWRWVWKDEFSQLESLYSLKCDPVDPVLEDVEFTYERALSVKGLPDPPEFLYDAAGKFGKDNLKVGRGDIKNQIVDQLVFPAPVLHTKASKLSSHDSYKIIRKFIQTNINPMAAKITSDYDFCFTVKKRIPLTEPEKYTVDLNAWSSKKRKPRLVVRYKKAREVECFEMTHADANYKGYTVIDGFFGKSHQDLKDNIDSYLKALIEFINKPLKDCPRCEGFGVILNPKKEDGSTK